MKHIIALICIVLLASLAYAQTNPTPQVLPYYQDFSTLPWNNADYPVGTQGWRIASNMSDQFNLSAPAADRIMNSRSYASTTQGNLHNYNGKIGFLSYGLADLSFAIAVNTQNNKNVLLQYDIMTLRNPFGTSNTRINEVTMLYRVGTTGPFTQLTGLGYINNNVNQIGDVTTPQKLEHRSITLPAECDNQPLVQLRLASRHYSGVGTLYPSFAIDNISVTGEDIPTLPVELSSFTASLTAENTVQLDWTTQSETGVAGFRLYRGLEADPAAALLASPLIPATNTSATHSYSFTDTELPASGAYRYWLQSTDLDGANTWHGPVLVVYTADGGQTTPEIPQTTGLISVFPNPFNPRAFIEFFLETPAPVVFRVYDAHGRLVRELEQDLRPAGHQRVEWDGRDAAGNLCGSGTYHIRMDVGTRSYSGKAVLLK